MVKEFNLLKYITDHYHEVLLTGSEKCERDEFRLSFNNKINKLLNLSHLN